MSFDDSFERFHLHSSVRTFGRSLERALCLIAFRGDEPIDCFLNQIAEQDAIPEKFFSLHRNLAQREQLVGKNVEGVMNLRSVVRANKRWFDRSFVGLVTR